MRGRRSSQQRSRLIRFQPSIKINTWRFRTISMSYNHDFIRMQILRMLYDYEQQKPRGSMGQERNDIFAVLRFMFNVPEKIMDFNIEYLEGKGLVKLIKSWGGGILWRNASITPLGIDAVEGKQVFTPELPFLNVNIQQVGDVYGGQVSQAIGSNISTLQVSDSFDIVQKAIRERTDLSDEKKTEALESLQTIVEEVKKETPDAGRLQRAWAWLKRNVGWVAPIITQVLIKYNMTDVLKILGLS